jgi:hypothetical protein
MPSNQTRYPIRAPWQPSSATSPQPSRRLSPSPPIPNANLRDVFPQLRFVPQALALNSHFSNPNLAGRFPPAPVRPAGSHPQLPSPNPNLRDVFPQLRSVPQALTPQPQSPTQTCGTFSPSSSMSRRLPPRHQRMCLDSLHISAMICIVVEIESQNTTSSWSRLSI